jgi:FemAB-related protein (PEP-CTERM system-associated)
MLVRAFTAGDRRQWNEFVRAHPLGSPFHLTAWMDSIGEVFPYRPMHRLAESEAGIEAVAPLFLVNNFLMGKVLLSTPFAVYGGVLARSPAARLALRDHLEALARQLRVDYLELRNAWSEQCLGFSVLERYVTFTHPIGSDPEAILNAIPRKTRYMVRKSMRHAFISRPAASSAAFEDLYARNLRRLGTPCFPKKHFEALLRHFGGDAEILEVLQGDRVVAAVLSFRFRDQVLPYYGASDPAFNEAAPNNFMYYDLMCRAGAGGARLFDFGRSRKDSGSHDFKAHWGMQERDLPYEILLVRKRSLPNVNPGNPRLAWAIRLWQRLPLPLTRWLGSRFIKLVP